MADVADASLICESRRSSVNERFTNERSDKRYDIDRTSSKVRDGEVMNETPNPHSFKIV